MCTIRFNNKKLAVLHAVYFVFRVALTVNSFYFSKQLICFCNRNGVFTARYELKF
jgi:hypothetical protein